MTLKTWLSISNVHVQKSKMSGGVSILPISNPHESPTRGCTLPTSCGPLKVRRHKDWKTRSVEDGLESSLEQGDYGFLEYFSSRQCSTKDYYESPRSKVTPCGRWNSMLNHAWGHTNSDWKSFAPTQFYPATLTRQDTSTATNSSRKRSRRERPHSIHHDATHKCFFRSDDVCTSTPIGNLSQSPAYKDNAFIHSQFPLHAFSQRCFEKPKNSHSSISSGILKRNSVLAKLRPDKWKSLEGTLRRCRSRDDVLASSQKKSTLGASQPDLLVSHNACNKEEITAVKSGRRNFISPPAPISILPPTCRHAPANVSQTLPRRKRPSGSNKENTLLARGRRWLTGGSTNKENDRNKTNLMGETTPCFQESGETPDRERILKQSFGENVFSPERRLTRGETFMSGQERDRPVVRQHQEKHPFEQMRCRRPLTFYLLEDYLSPVKAPPGIELDEFLGKAPRILFNQAPHKHLPPTPEWDIPSLSPPSSQISGGSRPQEQGSSFVPTSPSGNGGSTLGDSQSFSSPDKVGSRIYSPLVLLKGSEDYPRFVTPDQNLDELKSQSSQIGSPHLGIPHINSLSYPMSSLSHPAPVSVPATVYIHPNPLEEKTGTSSNETLYSHMHTHSFSSTNERLLLRTQELERRLSNAKEKRRSRNCDTKYKVCTCISLISYVFTSSIVRYTRIFTLVDRYSVTLIVCTGKHDFD